jgi:hypothetical protein
VERIIVRRGRYLTFELLRRTFGHDPNIEIIWDRRRAVSPAANADRPAVERRSSPPSEWERLDYLFTSRHRRPAPVIIGRPHSEPPTS